MRDDHWMRDAACAGHSPDLWHPVGVDDPREPAGKAICATCPVKAECLTHAIEHNEREGIWGGLTARERRHLNTNGLKTCTACFRELPILEFSVQPSGRLKGRCKTCTQTAANARARAHYAKKRNPSNVEYPQAYPDGYPQTNRETLTQDA